MGLPRFWGRVGRDLGEELADSSTSDDNFVRDTLLTDKSGHRVSDMWTAAYYILLVFGAVAFWSLRWKLTDSNLSLVDF